MRDPFTTASRFVTSSAMTRIHRLLVEILIPAPLGAILILIGGDRSEPLWQKVEFFPVFVLVSYLFCIIPSLFYALVMELWFRRQLHQKCWRFFTAIVSCVSGLLSGVGVYFLSLPCTKGSFGELLWLTNVGACVGTIIGIYLAFRVAHTI